MMKFSDVQSESETEACVTVAANSNMKKSIMTAKRHKTSGISSLCLCLNNF